MIFGYEPQTVVYAGLLLVIVLVLLRWHVKSDGRYRNFCLLHAFANREGFYDPDRAHLTASFLVCAFAVVHSVIRNAVTSDVVLLVGGFASVFALKSAWGYTVSRRTQTEVRTAEIRRGRFHDVPPEHDVDDPNAIEVKEEGDAPQPRRRSTDSVFR